MYSEYQFDIAMHGCCVGADFEFHKSIIDLINEPIERGDIRDAEDEKVFIHGYPCNIYDKSVLDDIVEELDYVAAVEPPLKRNNIMASLCDHLIVCPKNYHEQLRSGTWATYRYAKKYKKPITIIYPNGQIIHECR